MFFPRKLPLALEAERLLGARFTLNTPVISSGEVPSGPARAGIVVYASEAGRRALAIAIRSLRTSDATIFTFEDKLETDADVATAVDAALSFGESMGFLFDDEEVVEGDAAAAHDALSRWRELTAGSAGWSGSESARPAAGLEEAPSPTSLTPGAAAAPEEPELMLEDAIDGLETEAPSVPLAPEVAPAPPPPAATAPAAAEVPPVSSSVPLSKFRGARTAAPPPQPGAADRAGRAAALGRIPLRKRRAGETAEERPSLLLRILGGF